MPLYSLGGATVETPGEGNFWVAPNATVIGQVVIGDDVSIWFNAVIRGDNDLITLGARTNIQDGCVLHADPGFPLTIGPDCTIGHMAMLHGCTVGRGSLVGIGAIVLNGARIGEESLVGAHAFIPEGKEIPPRSLVLGAPARVIRQLGEEDVARLGQAIEAYRRKWRHFASGLRQQT